MNERLDSRCPVGIVAGRGRLPHLLIQRLHHAGKQVVIAGLNGQFAGQVPDDAVVQMFPIGQLRSVVDFFCQHRVHIAYWAGGISKKYGWTNFRPDKVAALLLPFVLWGGDDRLLRMVARYFEYHGIRIDTPSCWLPDMRISMGELAGPPVSKGAQQILGRLHMVSDMYLHNDCGQSLTGFGKDWVGTEDANGTDALMARTPGPGGVLLKRKKYHQDLRFDFPVIGPSTLLLAKRVGIQAIALGAGEVLIIDKPRVFKLATQCAVSIVGV